jgi:hypothetical protein
MRQSAEFLVSELVMNALRHAETAPVLHIQLLRPGFRVVVEDDSPDFVVREPADPDRRSEHGLGKVDAFAGAWGWDTTATGKRVWFDLA